MENTPIQAVINNNTNPSPKHPFGKLATALLVVIVVGLVGFMVWKLVDERGGILKKSYNDEDKLNILKELRSTPPDDGSVPMTSSEKIEILNDISNRKLDPSVERRTLTEDEQQKIFDSIQ